MSREVLGVVTAHQQREGAGFLVRRAFPTHGIDLVDPFLMLDEVGPVDYGPGEAIGAPDHPHRGFETVSYIVQGEKLHEDSTGKTQLIGPGDVQWMTAGSGIVHSELPSPAMQKNGGRAHGFQIWVNLPAKDKMMEPRYQDIPADEIPVAESDDGLVRARVVAGECLGASAVIETVIPIVYIHLTIQPGGSLVQPLDEGLNGIIYCFGGELNIEDDSVSDGQMAILSEGDSVAISVAEDADGAAEALLLAGQPLNEPIARHGPFVMNTEEELRQAFTDYQSGNFA